MLRGYVRPEPRFSAAKQRPVLLQAGVGERVIYQEDVRRRGDGFPERDQAISDLRTNSKDILVVSDYHRLATSAEDLKAVRAALRAKGAIVLEARTGRRSDNPEDYADMVDEARDFWAQRGMTKAHAAEIGKKGAVKSPVTKPKTGRMPLSEAQPIWRNPDYDVPQALALINGNPAYQTKYNAAYAYRNLGPRNVGAGRKMKDHGHKVKVRKARERLQLGAVYFLRVDGKGPVKIGFTTDIDHRLGSLATGHSGKIELIALIEGSRSDEKALHRRFKDLRVRGEWFKFQGDLKKYVAGLPPLPDLKY